jgi:hypothetical protein
MRVEELYISLRAARLSDELPKKTYAHIEQVPTRITIGTKIVNEE